MGLYCAHSTMSLVIGATSVPTPLLKEQHVGGIDCSVPVTTLLASWRVATSGFTVLPPTVGFAAFAMTFAAFHRLFSCSTTAENVPPVQ
jgi:hypothetical protein